MPCIISGKLSKTTAMCCMISNFENKEGQIQLSSSGDVMRTVMDLTLCVGQYHPGLSAVVWCQLQF